jgi:hypothetical protein
MPGSSAAVIGGGPAGLMAAEILSAGGLAVTVYDRMPSVGRKFLMAGRGGLNLTHSEDFAPFLSRYGSAAEPLRAALESFPPRALMDWAEGLGQTLFVGSSGRIFPRAWKASPLLRAWLARLGAQGVRFATRQDWRGWDETGALILATPEGDVRVHADATVLALGGASWPKLGANGAWAPLLSRQGVAVTAMRPANCGFALSWSDLFAARFAGAAVKNIALGFGGRVARGDAIVTAYGIEGGPVYALADGLRDAIAADGHAALRVDLRPDLEEAEIARRLAQPRPGQSLANILRKALRFGPLEIHLLREGRGEVVADPAALARRIKTLTLSVTAPQPLARAISTAGGIAFSALDESLMLRALPGVFAAGEMLDWEAPTGGYLLQACLATGVLAGRSALAYCRKNSTGTTRSS